MMMMFERMLQEQREMSEITTVVQRLVQRNGQFNGKDVSGYLRDYKAEMLRYGISERLQVTSFNRVATDELQESIHKIRQQNPTWESFEEAIRDAYDYLRPKRPRTWSMNGGQQWVKSDDRLPPKEESLMRKGSEMHGKSQVETEGELKTEPKSRPTKDEEEIVSQRLRTNDVAKNKADDLRVANTTSRVEEGFGKRLSETSREKGVSIIDACMIEGDKECEADVIEEVATKDDIESEVAMNESMADGRGKTLPTLIPEISAVAFEKKCETGETEGGGEKMKAEADAYNGEIAEKVAMCETTEDGNTEDSCPLILETSVVVSENQCEIRETGGGSKECKTRSRSRRNKIRPERKSNRAEADSAKRRLVKPNPDGS